MRSLTAPRRDPAPSKLAYRAERLWLTPLVRSLIRTGVPSVAIFFLVFGYVSDPATKAKVATFVEDMRRSVAERPEFRVERMAIDGASLELAEDIRDISNLDFPLSSFDLDLPGLRERLATLDAVAEVEMRILSGGVLQVDVVERVPALVWRSRQLLELIDAEGRRVSALGARTERGDLPLIVGEGADTAAAEAIALFAAAGPLTPRIRGLARIGNRRWDVVLDRDQRILLPEIRPVRALEQVIATDEAQDLLSRAVAQVDMRLPHRPTLRVTDAGVEEMRRLQALAVGADSP